MLWYQFGPFEAYYCHGPPRREIVALADATLRNVTDAGGAATIGGAWPCKPWATRTPPRQAFQKSVDLNPHFQPAIDAINALATP